MFLELQFRPYLFTNVLILTRVFGQILTHPKTIVSKEYIVNKLT